MTTRPQRDHDNDDVMRSDNQPERTRDNCDVMAMGGHLQAVRLSALRANHPRQQSTNGDS